MEELLIPKETSTGSPSSEKYLEKVVYPTSMSADDVAKLHQDILQKVVRKEADLESKIDNYKSLVDNYKLELDRQSTKSIEIIGIFSAILALLIIDVSIIKSVDSFLSAILLIVALTCSISIFSVLIHSFFAPEDKIKFGKYFWIPNIILIGLIILGLLLYFFNINISKIKIKSSENQPAIPQLPSTP